MHCAFPFYKHNLEILSCVLDSSAFAYGEAIFKFSDSTNIG